jgi:hypothetical protein
MVLASGCGASGSRTASRGSSSVKSMPCVRSAALLTDADRAVATSTVQNDQVLLASGGWNIDEMAPAGGQAPDGSSCLIGAAVLIHREGGARLTWEEPDVKCVRGKAQQTLYRISFTGSRLLVVVDLAGNVASHHVAPSRAGEPMFKMERNVIRSLGPRRGPCPKPVSD